MTQHVKAAPSHIEHFAGVDFPVHVTEVETERSLFLLRVPRRTLVADKDGTVAVRTQSIILPTFEVPSPEWASVEAVMLAVVRAYQENQTDLELDDLKSLLVLKVKPSGLICVAGTPHENPMESLSIGVPWSQLVGC